jgi:hypothetical protein
MSGWIIAFNAALLGSFAVKSTISFFGAMEKGRKEKYRKK